MRYQCESHGAGLFESMMRYQCESHGAGLFESMMRYQCESHGLFYRSLGIDVDILHIFFHRCRVLCSWFAGRNS